MKFQIIKKYGCPETEDLSIELENEVNEWISEGWKPFGSICIINVGTPEGYKNDFVEVWQAMVKE